MTSENPMLVALANLRETTEILEKSLSDQDLEKAHEAISVMLMQGTEMFGIEHPVMKQFFPVWSVIQQHIQSHDSERAVSQTATWRQQLDDVIQIVKNS